MLDGFRSQYPNNTIVLSSGDIYIRRPRYFTAGDDAAADVLGVDGSWRGDIAFLNAMGFHASAVGDHELDQGTGTFASIIGADTKDGRMYPCARFPYLAANLDLALTRTSSRWWSGTYRSRCWSAAAWPPAGLRTRRAAGLPFP